MKLRSILIISFLFPFLLTAQGFKTKNNGEIKFIFNEKIEGNQIQFSSSTPLENINGTAAGISGYISFNSADFAKTLKGKLSVPVKSINTGIELRNKHLQSSNWLDEPKYPIISFEPKSVSNFQQSGENKLTFKVTGNFTMHGVTKEVTAEAQAFYLAESEQTLKRAPGNLIGITADFSIKLSEFNVANSVIGNKVAENIILKILIAGSDKQ